MRRAVVVLAVVLLLAACTDDDAPPIATGLVTSGGVVQTVAAPAELEPAARVTVTAPLGGEVAELLVADGDVVQAGDPVARLASDSIDQQIAQAEAALEAAGAMAGVGGAGFDLSPLLAGFRGQLEATVPPMLEALAGQVEALAAVEVVDAAALDTARDGLARAEQAYADARGELQSAEAEARQQARAAEAGQAAAAEAQRRQAELTLEAARARIDDLEILAPAGGVVELVRGDAGGSAPDLGSLAGEAEGLLGGVGGAGGGGRVATGSTVVPGQALLTIYDLSSFTVRASVDEIDIVQVEVGQPALVLVDAFPEAELTGEVGYIALAPRQAATGGRSFAVTVDLVDVPDGVSLRVGLTASVEIAVRDVEADTVVPTSALLRQGESDVVYVVRDGIAFETPVEVVAIGDTTAAVRGDLAPGDEVVTVGVEQVADGAQVG